MHYPGLTLVNTRVSIVIDGVYEFTSQGRVGDFNPQFNDLFAAGCVDRETVIEVCVYNILPPEHGNFNQCQLLGACRLSTEHLFQGRPSGKQNYLLANSDGVAGTVELTLTLESSQNLKGDMDKGIDTRCISRLVQFLLQNDKARLRDVNILLSTMAADGVSPVIPELSVNVLEDTRDPCAAFERLMRSLCDEYHCEEPPHLCVHISLESCVFFEESEEIPPSGVFVVFRSASEQFVSPMRTCKSNAAWAATSGLVAFDVINPEHYSLDIMVYRTSPALSYDEIGRARVRVFALTEGYKSKRQFFFSQQGGQITPRVTGVVHLTMEPLGFGLSPTEMGGTIDLFHSRLSRFFFRYDRRRLQEIDVIIYSRKESLEELMDELEVYYGREPGAAVLRLTVVDVQSLLCAPSTDLDEEDVMVVTTMGCHSRRTDTKRVIANLRTVFCSTFHIDVVRETDMIRFQVVKAGCEDVVYGSVDFFCIKMQKGVENVRRLYLIGSAGTGNAFLSGTVTITLFSESLGQPYAVDVESERMYSGRLRRYANQYAPEKLHLVNLVVATVFDIDAFMEKVSRNYGEEHPTDVLHMTVLGCRKLPKRFGFNVSAYVVARMGVDRFETCVVRSTTKPDYFEFFEFFTDKVSNAEITLVVMDRYDVGSDKEIGRTVIPLERVTPDHQYNRWLPLTKHGSPTCGFVGVMFVVKNLRLQGCPCDRVKGEMNPKYHEFGQEGLAVAEESPPKPGSVHYSNVFLHALNMCGEGKFHLHSGQSRGTESVCRAAVCKESEEVLGGADGFVFEGLGASPGGGTSPTNNFLRPVSQSVTPRLSSTDAHTPRIGRMGRVPQSLAVTTTDMFLHVHLHYCEGLEEMKLFRPSPYVMLTTLTTTHISETAFETFSPRYDDVFQFPVYNPNEDSLSIAVVADTPYGRKTLGCCTLSTKNVCRNAPQTRCVALVVAPHGVVAQQRGVVCISLLGENFGLHNPPNMDSERRFRQWARIILLHHAPADLHRLEWCVGEYSVKDCKEVEGGFASNKLTRAGEDEAVIHVSVKNVTNFYCGGLVVSFGLCSIVVEVGGRTVHRISGVKGIDGCFDISEGFDVRLQLPLAQTLRFVVDVKSGSKNIRGECVVSLSGVRNSTMGGQTHYIVENPGLSSAIPIGCITVAMSCERCGRVRTRSCQVDEAEYVRMRNYYFYHIREQLHMVNAIYSRILNVSHHLEKLTELYGPEPGSHQLRLEVVRCVIPSVERGTIYFVLELGLLQYKALPILDNPDLALKGFFTVSVEMPEMDELHLMVFLNRPGHTADTEVGRTVIPFRDIVRGREVLLLLPLVRHAQTKHAELRGCIEVLLFTDDFGLGSAQRRNVLPESLREWVRWEVARSSPKDVHRVPNILADMRVQGEWINKQLRRGSLRHPSSASGNEIRVLLLGFQYFFSKSVYINVKLNGCKKLLRTGDLVGKRLNCINEEFTVDCSVVLVDSVFTLKLAECRANGSCVLCRCDFTVVDCPPGVVTRKWLRLFDDRGRAVGRLGVLVDVPGSAYSLAPRCSTQSREEVESVTDDVVSLLQKYRPQGLRRLDLVLGRSDDMTATHRLLRHQLAPKALATIYCEVLQVRLSAPAKAYPRIEFSLGDEVECVGERTYGERVVDSNTPHRGKGYLYLHFPPARMDVGAAGVLQITVHDGEAEQGHEELGTVLLSLRALLTPQLYKTGEAFCVSFVKRWRVGMQAHAAVVGTVTLRLSGPIFEQYPDTFHLFEGLQCTANCGRMRHCFDRIYSFLQRHDANSLLDIHRKVFEEFVVKPNWSAEIQDYLHRLMERWREGLGASCNTAAGEFHC